MAQKEEDVLLHDNEEIMMEQEEEHEAAKYGMLSHCDQLIVLLVLCFKQFLPTTCDTSIGCRVYVFERTFGIF